jgi:hypothetical protein
MAINHLGGGGLVASHTYRHRLWPLRGGLRLSEKIREAVESRSPSTPRLTPITRLLLCQLRHLRRVEYTRVHRATTLLLLLRFLLLRPLELGEVGVTGRHLLTHAPDHPG